MAHRLWTPLNVVQELLGHKNIETTMRYAHADIRTVSHFLHSQIGARSAPKISLVVWWITN
jgi:site-specific recombinase XerC